jgi:hypothetical protein
LAFGVIQGTFGVIQGTFGVIQGTFGVIQGTFGVIQRLFGVIQRLMIRSPFGQVGLWAPSSGVLGINHVCENECLSHTPVIE